MTETPPGAASSWVDLSRETGKHYVSSAAPSSPNRSAPVTPVPFNTDTADYLKMLKEAQRENSARSSARVSPISSAMMSVSSTCKNTPSASPKSPPNSPNTELACFQDSMKGVIINRESENHEDAYFNWRSRPNIHPSAGTWRMPASSKVSSGNQSDSEERRGLEKPQFNSSVPVLITSNLLSLTIGALIGYWILKKGIAKS